MPTVARPSRLSPLVVVALLVPTTPVACGPGQGSSGMTPASEGGADDSGSTVDGGGAGPDGAAPAEGGDAGAARMEAAAEAGSDLGAPCTAATATSVCVEGTLPFCIASPGWGKCSSTCMLDTDCPADGVCVTGLLLGSNKLPTGVCLPGCTSNGDCGTGFVCDPGDGTARCMPQDCRYTPSSCTSAETCNEQTGTCSASALAPGYPASFPTPAVISTYGGPTLTSPVLVPMFFSNDNDATAPVADMVEFFQKVGGSNYWKALAEYGVGPPTQVLPVMLGQAAPASLDDSTSSSQLKQLLAGFIANRTGGTPAPTAETLYVLVLPSGTSVTQGGQTAGGTKCPFLGYHEEVQAMGGTFPYAVVLRCQVPMLFATDLEAVTSAASHEVVEAVTDPFPFTMPAWVSIDSHHGLLVEGNPGTELGDMCEADPEANTYFWDLSFVVQRFWSNAAAAAGHDPCVPAYPKETFFTGAPVLGSSTTVSFMGQSAATDSVSIPVGQSGTVSVEFYSDGTTAPWKAGIIDYECLTSPTTPALLGFSLSAGTNSSCGAVTNAPLPCVTQACTVQNGSTVNVSVHVNQAGNPATNGEASSTELFGVLSWQGTGAARVAHVSWGIVSP